jgi:hypothetical protein
MYMVRVGVCIKCGIERDLFMNSKVCKVCAAEKSRVTLREKRERRLALEAEAGKAGKKRGRDEKAGLASESFGSKRLIDTLDSLCGDDLPDKNAPWTNETTALLIIVAAVILYILFFQGRGGSPVTESADTVM